MALRVWLPLDGDLHNQGASGLEFTNLASTNTIVDNAGKIGKCYINNSNSAGGLISNMTIDLGTNQSMFCWVNFTSLEASSNLGGGLISQHRYSSNKGMGLTIKYVSSTTGYLSVNTGNGSSRTYNTYCASTLMQAGIWYHVGYTYDGTNIKLYVNGINEKIQAYAGMSVPAEYLTVFCWSMSGTSGNSVHGDYKLKGKINDVRVYDHCLSDAEVHEISQGLVLHYKLDHTGSGANLIINGDGSAGTTNWSNTNNISSEVPSSAYSHSFFNNQTTQYIFINPLHQYHIEEQIKAASGATGTCYPSLLPYDIDKNFISTAHMSFNSATLTTLTQQLKAGDTKIYVASLANWNANSGHYYNYAAIFGYKDSTGYTYPDLGYTRNTPAFGSGTNAKTNLDKTNNIITLNSAYTGPTMPVGTKVCASTDGSTYWYPYGGINMTTITDWTTKSYNFIPQNDARLRYARYVRYYTYANNNVYHAGIKLVDLTDTTGVKDSSGYNHNGTIVGQIDITQTETRYTQCLRWNSSSPTDNSDTGMCYIQTPFTLTTPLQMSVAWWAKPESGYGGSTSHAAFCTSSNASRPTDYNTTAFHHRDTGFDIYPSDASGVKRLSFTYTANAWHHYVITYDGSTAKAYQDGVLKTSVAIGTNKTLATFSQLYIGYSQAGGVRRKTLGAYSDFRIYCTALSADDIKALYEVSAKADNLHGFHSYEFTENNSKISITKTGQIKCNEINEVETIKLYKSTNNINAKEFIEI